MVCVCVGGGMQAIPAEPKHNVCMVLLEDLQE